MVERQMISPTRRTIVQDSCSDFNQNSQAALSKVRKSPRSPTAAIAAQNPTDMTNDTPEAVADNERLADYFAIIGLAEELRPIDNGYDQIRTIEKVEIVIMERWEVSEVKKQLHQQRAKKNHIINGVDPQEVPRYDPDKEKWIDLDGTKNFYLHLTYGHNNPITDINFYYIAQKHEHKLAVPAKENMHLVPVRRHDREGVEVNYHTTFQQGSTEERNALVFHGVYDLKHYLDRQELSNYPKTGLSSPASTNKALCLAVKRQKKLEQPIYEVNVIQGEGDKKLKTYQLQEGIKIVTYRLGLKKDRLLSFMKVDLLKTRFTPKVLDRYPPEDRADEPFLEGIVNFCFPTGIQLHRNHLTPQSFHFLLTGAEGHRNYGTVLCFDEECPRGLKRKLKHAKHEDYNKVWTQKAICIMSKYSFFESFKQVLNKLYQVHLSQNMTIPIERFVVNILDEVPLPDLGKNMVAYEEKINFYRPIDQYPPYTDANGIQNLFKALDVAGVVELFTQLALERKILLVSKHKTLLTQVAVALCSFIFPLSWQHTMIPILPIQMIGAIDAPFPFLIGVQAHILNEALNNQVIEMPQHVTIVNLDGNDINTSESSVQTSKFPQREFKVLKEKLMRATQFVGERPHSDLELVDDAFMRILVDPDEEDSQIDSVGVRDAFLEFMSRIMENYKKYLKDPGMNAGRPVNDHAGSKDFFNFDKFRQEKDATRPQSFIHKLTQTSNFGYFIESRSLGRSVNDEQIIYFDRIVKQKRTAKNPTLLEPFEPKKIIRAEAPSELNLVPEVKYMYEVFPNSLDRSLYYKPRRLQYHSDSQRSVHKQMLTKEQIKTMNEADWARYMAEVIYCMWFHVFGAVLPMYMSYSSELIFFARKLLQHISKKLTPMREVEIIYRRMFEACGNCMQQQDITELYQEMLKMRYIDHDKVTDGTYYQSLLLSQRDPDEKSSISQSDRKNQYYPVEDLEKMEIKRKQEEAKEWNENQASEQRLQDQSSFNTAFRSDILNVQEDFEEFVQYNQDSRESIGSNSIQQPQEKVIKLSQVLEGSLYIELQKECSSCEIALREEELFSQFTQEQSDYTVKCPHCNKMFVPKFLIQSEYYSQYINGREGLSMHLLPPVTLYKEFINMLAKKGDQILTQEMFITEHSVVFWNLVIYFRIFKLPVFFLDQDYSSKHTRVQVSWIKKYLPSKVLNQSQSMGMNSRSSFGSKTRLDSDGLKKLDRQVEKSPARNSSLTRVVSNITSGLGNLIKRSSSKGKGPQSKTSHDGAPPTGKHHQSSLSKANLATIGGTSESLNSQSISAYGAGTTPSSALKYSPSLQISDMKNARIKTGSVRSGSGPGSIIGSTTSDLERLDRLMKQSQHANKSIVRMFGKHLEEFRREMAYSKDIINSDLIPQNVPDQMARHTQEFNATNRSNEPFKKVVNQRISMDNLSIEQPEARLSNASNGRQGQNSTLQSKFQNLKTMSSQQFSNKPPSGMLSQINEDSNANYRATKTFVQGGAASRDQNQVQRPPLSSYQHDISPLANYMENQRSQSANQQPESKGAYQDDPSEIDEDPTGGQRRI